MKHLSTTLLLLWALACGAQTTRVLIVGDSWASQQWDDGVHDAVFAVNGYPQFISFGDDVAISGSTAAEWVVPSELQKITDALNANPDIDTVQLTLGGNDFLDQWNTAMTPTQVQDIQDQIIADLQLIVDHILAHDIGIEVVLSFYDYPNFVDTLTGPFHEFCEDLHNSLGAPTALEINTMGASFEQAFASVATNNPRVAHVSHFGLMQNLYGFPGQNIDPGTIQPPGDISLPSPVEAMRLNLGFIVDCFHLTPEGYDVLVQNTYEQYFQYRFDTILKSSFE